MIHYLKNIEHRKDVVKKYIEYEIVLMQEFRDQGKTLDDVIGHMKTILWYVKKPEGATDKKCI